MVSAVLSASASAARGPILVRLGQNAPFAVGGDGRILRRNLPCPSTGALGSRSPNGKYALCLVSSRFQPTAEVHVITIATGRRRTARLAPGRFVSAYWSPDSRRIAVNFAGSRQANVMSIDAATASPSAIASYPEQSCGRPEDTACPKGRVRGWTPNGQEVFILVENAVPGSVERHLVLRRHNTAQERLVMRNVDAAWPAPRRQVVVVGLNGRQFVLIGYAGNQVSVLPRLAAVRPVLGGRVLPPFHWFADGRRLLFQAVSGRYSVYDVVSRRITLLQPAAVFHALSSDGQRSAALTSSGLDEFDARGRFLRRIRRMASSRYARQAEWGLPQDDSSPEVLEG